MSSLPHKHNHNSINTSIDVIDPANCNAANNSSTPNNNHGHIHSHPHENDTVPTQAHAQIAAHQKIHPSQSQSQSQCQGLGQINRTVGVRRVRITGRDYDNQTYTHPTGIHGGVEHIKGERTSTSECTRHATQGYAKDHELKHDHPNVLGNGDGDDDGDGDHHDQDDYNIPPLPHPASSSSAQSALSSSSSSRMYDENDVNYFVSDLMGQMSNKFETMGKSILNRIDAMGGRIDHLERSIGDLLHSQVQCSHGQGSQGQGQGQGPHIGGGAEAYAYHTQTYSQSQPKPQSHSQSHSMAHHHHHQHVNQMNMVPGTPSVHSTRIQSQQQYHMDVTSDGYRINPLYPHGRTYGHMQGGDGGGGKGGEGIDNEIGHARARARLNDDV